MSQFYVYVLFDWLGTPRYVGKGKGDREDHHERRTDRLNTAKNEFIEQTYIMLGEVPKIRVREGMSNEEALALEIELIKIIGRLDLRTGPLMNLTVGGDGLFIGKRHTTRTLQLLSNSAKDQGLGKNKSPEHQAKIATKNIARSKTLEFKAWRKRTSLRLWQDPVYRAKMLSVRRGKVTWRWITNGSVNRALDPGVPLPAGWRFGKVQRSRVI